MKARTARMMAAAAALAVTGLSRHWVAFAIAAAIVGAWWLVRLSRYPWGPCWWCRGRSGRAAGSDKDQWGDCARCNRTGRRLRLGVGLVRPDLKGK